jgi:hypothetical protein
MTTLRERINSSPKEVQANWPFYSAIFDSFLKDYAMLPAFTSGKTNEEIGIAVKAIGEIRAKIQDSSMDPIQPPPSPIKKLKSITRIKHD